MQKMEQRNPCAKDGHSYICDEGLCGKARIQISSHAGLWWHLRRNDADVVDAPLTDIERFEIVGHFWFSVTSYTRCTGLVSLHSEFVGRYESRDFGQSPQHFLDSRTAPQPDCKG